MNTVYQTKELAITDSPFVVFDCTLTDGRLEHWSTQSVSVGTTQYLARILRHNLFESQTALDQGVDSIPRLVLELANADSHFSELERSVGFKGATLRATFVFLNLASGVASTDSKVVFRGILNASELLTETTCRLSAMNKLSAQRLFLPPIQIQRRCAWTFPSTLEQRAEAVAGGTLGRFSPYYPCGYSADITGGCGNLIEGRAFTSCTYTRSDCEARGMFRVDSRGSTTGRFSGLEFVPSTIRVRSNGEGGSHLSPITINEARYNNFVPLIYGTAWIAPEIVFSRNDGNLTRMEVLIGMGPITGIYTVLVNNIQIPLGINGVNMTGTGWYNVISLGERNGAFDLNFADSNGNPLGDPYGSMAYLAIVVPNRINDGTTLPDVQVLVNGIQVRSYNADGSLYADSFSSNPCWIILDILLRSGWSITEVDLTYFAASAAYCDATIQTLDANNNPVSIPRFQCNLALQTRRSLGDVLRGIRNCARLYFTFGFDGLLRVNIENTLALQQPTLPLGSNADIALNGGWPAYEFGDGSTSVSGILRNADGSSTVRLSSKISADCANQFSVEFQDAFNEYQQDSFSVVDADDVARTGQQVSAGLYALGLPNFDQAARILTFNVNKSVNGNLTAQFQTSVKALGLFPGDIITLTYLKEGFQRQPFRILKISPSTNYRRVTITAQIHDDSWYTDVGARNSSGKRLPSAAVGLPRPLTGTVLDSNGVLQFGVEETSSQAADGTVNLEANITFVAPASIPIYGPGIPTLSLSPSFQNTGGMIPGGTVSYYAISAVDSNGDEGSLSFVVRSNVPAGTMANSVTLSNLSFPTTTATFNVYRGPTPSQLNLISSGLPPSAQFTDTGLAAQTAVPPDPNYDHANFYWRLELHPEAVATLYSSTSVGNESLTMAENDFRGKVVRITRGTGAGQERSIITNDARNLLVSPRWDTTPDGTSYFAISQPGFQFGATSTSNQVQFSIPNRPGATIEISGRAANSSNLECPYELCPLTRWQIGSSGGSLGDTSVPGAPVFGLSLSQTYGGTIQLGEIGFATLVNTSTTSAGTYTLHFYNELLGPPTVAVSTNCTALDTSITLSTSSNAEVNSLIQIGAEVLQVTGRSNDQLTLEVTRGLHGTTASSHASGTLVYLLASRVLTVPFVYNFFGSPASGNWSYSVPLPNVRLATAELFVTNSQGNSPISYGVFTNTLDQGLRTLSGGQYSFQVAGFLAIQNGAAPDISVEGPHAIRDVFAVVKTASSETAIALNVNLNGNLLCSLEIPPSFNISGVVRGLTLPALTTGGLLSLDITSVGQAVPGSDLTVIVRL